MTDSGEHAAREGTPACDCKVGDVSQRYDLTEVLLEVETRWTGPESERESVRELTDRFNEQVLRTALREAGVNSMDSDIETIYDRLTNDDVSSGIRTQVQQRLAREGVPIERVVDDFVSHQSVYLHLTECKQLSYQPTTDDRDRVDLTRQQLMALRERMVRVTDDKLEHLDTKGLITADEVTVLVDTTVFCEHCNTGYSLTEFLEQGGCDCTVTSTESD